MSKQADMAALQANAALMRLAAVDTQAAVAMAAGHLVGLLTECMRRQGLDSSGELRIDGGASRDITIHPVKVRAAREGHST